MTTTYIIKDATNDLFYTEDHAIPVSDRWSPNFLHAYQFSTRYDAEQEIQNESFNSSFFLILEVTIKN